MARDEHTDDPAQFRPEDELDEVFARANPNPDRIGCPPHDVLRALARRQRPLGDPAYEHLARCSPCYRDFRRLQAENHRARASRKLIASAALILVVVTGALCFVWVRGTGSKEQANESTGSGAPNQRTVADLRPYSPTRGPDSKDQPPLRFSRSNLGIDILLPVGSEPGPHELRVLDGNLQTRLSKPVTAEMRNYVVTIRTELDLRSLAPGGYQLALRRPGEEWGLYPARVE